MENGVTLLLEPIEQYQSASIGFFVIKGSRDEANDEKGFTHFCEHMLFKGTEKLSKNEIAESFDSMGGYINAYTTHELVLIYNRVPFFNLISNLELITDIFNNSIFNENELNLERDVIISEIRSVLEEPQEKIHEDFISNMFKNNSLSSPIIGNEQSINEVPKEVLSNFFKKTFTAENLVISIAGKYNKDEVVNYLNKINFRKNNSKPATENKAKQTSDKSGFTILPSEQLHIMTGTSKFDITTEEYFRCGLLNVIIGESMSSRLFQRIREDLGLCYSIYSYFSKFRYENVFGLYLSILPKNGNKAISEISKIFKELKKDGINSKELEQIKTQKIGEIILNYDILQKRMQRSAQFEIKYGKNFTHNEIIKIINQTTIKDINLLIEKIFIKENFFSQYLYKKKLDLDEWDF